MGRCAVLAQAAIPWATLEWERQGKRATFTGRVPLVHKRFTSHMTGFSKQGQERKGARAFAHTDFLVLRTGSGNLRPV